MKQDYNQKYYPTAFFDGGKKVLVGGYDDESYYGTRIESCGQRDVHELNLTASVEWMGNAVLEIEINIVNNEKISNSPPDTPTIEGPTSGEAGKEYEYRFSAIDVDSDDLYYCIDWGAVQMMTLLALVLMHPVKKQQLITHGVAKEITKSERKQGI